MNYRLIFAIIFTALSLALAVCGLIAFRSKKTIGVPLGRLLCCLIPPLLGNLLIIGATTRTPATIGCYLYYIGIDFTVFSLLRYTLAYCNIPWKNNRGRVLVLSLLGIDVIQLALNPFFGHAFSLERIELYGGPYYRMVPYLPQNLHRLLVYGLLAAVVVILFLKMRHSSRINANRYGVIFFTLLAVIIWCTFYVVSRTPLDRSMIGYAVFGLLAFYFSLYYKPLLLLNRIMMDISAELPDAVFFFDDAGDCIWLNREGRRLLNIQGQDLDGAAEKLKPFYASGPQTDDWTSRLELDADGGRRYYALEKRTIRDGRGCVDGSFLSVRDDTEAQLKLKREAYRARHDELTGLYTRPYLYRRIRERLAEAPDEAFCIAFANVSSFKLINDVFGVDFGDSVLKQIAEQMRRYMPEGSVYGRLGGDTFGVLIPRAQFDPESVEKRLTNFTVKTGELDYHVLIHVGVYEVRNPGLEVSVMFDRARIAASSLRSDFHTHIAWYDDRMRENLLWEQEITGDLQDALARRQIVPYLQPLVNNSGKVVGAEALVRWNHPKYGFLPPVKFIPIFEQNGMIAEVDRYMWRCACEQLVRWRDNDLFISVNISPKDFYFMDVAAEIQGLVKEYGVDPARLRLEITESVMISDVENKVALLGSLREAGFIVEMDDFGSGYSSLNMLKNMPIDVIKIDMVFLRNSEQDEKSRMILRNIINMSTDLSIVPLTEGVETEKQYDDLSRMGCKLFQGYFFAKPMSVDDFESRYVEAA